MSVLNAILALQDYLAEVGGLDSDAVIALKGGTAAASGFDFDSALKVFERYPATRVRMESSRTDRLRHMLRELILALAPSWLRLVPRGRSHVRSFVEGSNLCHCLDCAELFSISTPSSTSALTWWDDIAAIVRSTGDAERLRIGREGEILTLEYEAQRLQGIGRADLRPFWVSVEDNSLGYDVRSFDISDDHVSSLFIEVKTSYAQPPKFFLSRSEWQHALILGANYALYFWILPARRLMQYSFQDLEAHIPTDRGDGHWQSTEIVATTR
jgi:hypothetical protein